MTKEERDYRFAQVNEFDRLQRQIDYLSSIEEPQDSLLKIGNTVLVQSDFKDCWFEICDSISKAVADAILKLKDMQEVI